MIIHNKHFKPLYGICRANGYSHAMALDFIGHLSHLEKHNGLNYVVNVLKDRFHSLVSGQVEKYKLVKGLWIGCWKHLHRISLRSRRGLRQALRILRCYGLFIHPAPTKADYQRAAQEVSQRKDRTSALEPDEIIVDHFINISVPRTINSPYPLGTKRAPLKDGRKLAECFISPLEHIESLDLYPHFCVKYYMELQRLVGKDIPPINHFETLCGERGYDVAGSAVLLTKDRGYKLRLIANCNRMLQLALARLHRVIDDGMKLIPECHVHDQDEGARWVAERIKEGWQLTSLDLKSASDNIPLGPQLALWSQLFPSLGRELEMFGDIARMSWSTPIQDVWIRWTCGHPMGVNCSFGLFTTWLIDLFYKSGAQGCFAIVGDDLVFDSSFEPEILARLSYFGIPISHGKSLFGSDTTAEFVGRIIDKYGSLEVFKASPFKFSEPLGIVRQYGPKAVKYLGPKRLFGHNYKLVVDTVVQYFQDEESRAAVEAYANPFEYLTLKGMLPTPVVQGGISPVILGKMLEEAWSHMEPAPHPFMKDMYETMSPRGRTYEIIRSELPVVSVTGYTVPYNDYHLVDKYNRLIRNIKECEDMEEAMELLSQYHGTHLDPPDRPGLKVKEVQDGTTAQKLVKQRKMIPDDKHEVCKTPNQSAVRVVFSLILRVHARIKFLLTKRA